MSATIVSIILPTYNRADIISRAIDSVLAQTVVNWELVIVDDGSTDDTSDLLKKYLTDQRIRFFSRSHQGVVRAVNFGIKQTKTAALAFIGSDDYFKANHLEINLKYMDEHSEIDLVHSYVEVIGSRWLPDITRPGQMIDIDECYHEGTSFVRRRVFNKIQFDEGIGEGYRFIQKALALGFKIIKLPSCTYVYDRSRQDSLTKQLANSFSV